MNEHAYDVDANEAALTRGWRQTTARMVAYQLPYPPSVNRYWRTWKGKMLISKEGRQYREAVGVCVQSRPLQKMTGRLRVDIHAYLPDLRRRDIDNLPKAILDSLQASGVFEDDNQVRHLTVQDCGLDRPDGYVLVHITELVCKA